MKRLLPLSLFALLTLAVTPGLHAQWVNETYHLQPGWNAIYLQGDASYTTPTELFKDYPTVLEVWRWNPNPNQIQFSTSPAVPDATSSEWTIWKRDDATEQQLTAMIGQSAYLVHCDDAVPGETPLVITQKPVAPSATWLITGANFIGLPADPSSSAPTFQSYFASFPIAVTAPSKIYKYVGGSLGATNPIEVVAPANELINRNTAYWFQAATVGDFTGLVSYELPDGKGLAFGRTLSTITVGVTNRSSSPVTLTVSLDDSRLVSAPTGQTDRTGPVPLTHLVMNSATATYVATPISGSSFTVTISANGRADLLFGIDRSQLSASDSSSAIYASLLRIKDSAQMTDVYLPVTAQKADPAGLWVGYVNVNSVASNAGVVINPAGSSASVARTLDFAGVTVAVGSKYQVNVDGTAFSYTAASGDALADVVTRLAGTLDADSTLTASAAGNVITISDGAGLASLAATADGTQLNSGSTVASPFTLRILIHVDGSGVARLLSQAFVGNLASTGHNPGVCTKESLLWADTKKDALRIVSSHLPLDRVLDGAGSFAVGHSLSYTVNLDYADPTNPFVHEYHPDHDNLDARFKPLAAGVESYTVTRHLTFTFTAAPPDGSTVTGWGSTVYGGVYSESIDGLNRRTLRTGGGFGLRRVSEIAELTTD